jgi:DNA-binding transcriptional regulator YhcF (GntR family)
MTGTTFPSIGQYNKACREPEKYFTSVELKAARFQLFGNPILRNYLRQGAFAAVAKASIGEGELRAVRFFLKQQEGLRDRYARLGGVFERADLKGYTIPVRFLANAVEIDSQTWDAVEMKWVEGTPLGVHVFDLVTKNQIREIELLADAVISLGALMKQKQVSHGDLTPENIVVSDGVPILVDYDSFWSEELRFLPNSIGPGKMQHPGVPSPLGPFADRVPLAIYRLGFGAILSDPDFFKSRSDLFDQNRFVLDREMILHSKDVSAIPIPNSLSPLLACLKEVLSGPYHNVTQLDPFLFGGSALAPYETAVGLSHESSLRRTIRDVAYDTSVEDATAVLVYRELFDKFAGPDFVVDPSLMEEFRVRLASLALATDPIPNPRATKSEEVSRASKIKINELAKKLGMTNEELLDLCKSEGVAAKTPQSTVAKAFVPMLERKAKARGLVRVVQPENLEPMKSVTEKIDNGALGKESAVLSHLKPSHSPARPVSASGRPIPLPPGHRLLSIGSLASEMGVSVEVVENVCRAIYGRAPRSTAELDKVRSLWRSLDVGNGRRMPKNLPEKIMLEGQTTGSLARQLGLNWRDIRRMGLLLGLAYWPTIRSGVDRTSSGLIYDHLRFGRVPGTPQNIIDGKGERLRTSDDLIRAVRRMCFNQNPSVSEAEIETFMAKVLPLAQWENVRRLPGLKVGLRGPSTINAVEKTLGLEFGYLTALLIKEGIEYIRDPMFLYDKVYLQAVLKPVGVIVLEAV